MITRGRRDAAAAGRTCAGARRVWSRQVKAYERLAARAAVSHDRDTALEALLANPLVPSWGVAERMLPRLLDANRDHLPGWDARPPGPMSRSGRREPPCWPSTAATPRPRSCCSTGRGSVLGAARGPGSNHAHSDHDNVDAR